MDCQNLLYGLPIVASNIIPSSGLAVSLATIDCIVGYLSTVHRVRVVPFLGRQTVQYDQLKSVAVLR